MVNVCAMMNFNGLAKVIAVIAVLSFVGCGDSSIAPVSGKVTVDGEPVEGIRVVYSPILAPGKTDAGPWSSGLTNSAGEYALETRHKDNGAVIGTHTVSFVYDDIDSINIYRELLSEAKQDGDQAAMAAAKKDIDAYNAKQKTRPKAAGDHTEKFDVPSGGTNEANFELPE